jgi:hypothetical protein
MKMLTIAMAAVTLIGASALAQTQGQTHASHDYKKTAPSSERPDCEAMKKKMGLGAQHSHAEQKGVVAKSRMNSEHDRCRAEAKKTADNAK